MNSKDEILRAPVYQQLYQLLGQLITSGEFKPGAQFLTERGICERFKVSRVTANKALSNLVVEGRLEFRKGVGTFVQEGSLEYDLRTIMSFTHQVESEGMKPHTQVLAFDLRGATQVPPTVLNTLQAGPKNKIFEVLRLRFADEKPMILERRYLPAARFPKLTRRDLAGSFYNLVTNTYHLEITNLDQTILAQTLSEEDAKLFQLPPAFPVLQVHGAGHAGGPLWVEETLYRGDVYAFRNIVNATKSSTSGQMALRSSTELKKKKK